MLRYQFEAIFILIKKNAIFRILFKHNKEKRQNQSEHTEVAKGAPIEFNGGCVATFAWFKSERQGVS